MNGGDVLQLLAAVELYVQTVLSVLCDSNSRSSEAVDGKTKAQHTPNREQTKAKRKQNNKAEKKTNQRTAEPKQTSS